MKTTLTSKNLGALLAATALMATTMSSQAQLFWNPDGGPYSASSSKSGAWDGANPPAVAQWWNGSSQVVYTANPIVFEGSGTVTGQPNSSLQPNNAWTFQNLSGNYVFTSTNTNMRWNGTGANQLSVASTAGSNNVTFARLRFGGAAPTVANNSSGVLTFTQMDNVSGGTNTIAGTGLTRINSITGGARTIAKSGSGTLEFTGSSIVSGTTLTLNDGALFLNAGAADASFTSMLWNDGDLRFNLSSLTTLALTGNLTKGSGSAFDINFGGFNATTNGTYNLIDFGANVGFVVGDFSATGITYGSGLSGSFELTGSSLNFVVVPEPSTWLLVGVGLGIFTLFRRRRA